MPLLRGIFLHGGNVSDPVIETRSTPDYLSAVQTALRAGDRPRAHAVIGEWLADAPNHPEALYFRAVAERTEGRLEEALKTLGDVLAVDPLHSRALQESGHVRRRLQDPRGALHDYRRATRLNPSLLASWVGQAELLQLLGHPAARQADAEVAHLRSLPPPLIVVMDLVARGRLGKAETLCKRFMQKNPRHVEGMRLLADIAVRMGALEEAHLLLDAGRKLSPENRRIAVDLVQLLRKEQRFAQAVAQAEALAASHPDDPQLQSIAGVEQMQVGQYDQALAHFDRVLEQLPHDPVTLTTRGHALKTAGHTEAAVASYRAALTSQPDYGEAWHSLANLKTYRFDRDDIGAMQALCEHPDLDHNSRIFLEFALGKALEDAGEFNQSFAHYASGNRAKRLQSNYDGAQLAAEFAQQKALFTPAFLDPFKESGYPASDPIFIVGLPRAGSTLLEQILASHSQVDGTLELPNILSLVQRLRRRPGGQSYPQVLATLDNPALAEFGREYIEGTRIHRQGAPRFIDKMPNNFRHIGLISLILPNARIIDARRNPMACCFSGFKQLFAEGQEFSYDLADMGSYYREYVALMDHWQALFPGRILQVDNEAIIADLEGQVRRLLDFCGLPFETACLHYWETDRAIKTPSSEQVRRPVSADGQHQWRNFSASLQPLRDALGPELASLSDTSTP